MRRHSGPAADSRENWCSELKVFAVRCPEQRSERVKSGLLGTGTGTGCHRGSAFGFFISAEYKYLETFPFVVCCVSIYLTWRETETLCPPHSLTSMTILKDSLHSLDIPVLLSLANMSLLSSVCLAASSFLVYLVSLAFYRLYLHPLAQHPGPFLARISDWLVPSSPRLVSSRLVSSLNTLLTNPPPPRDRYNVYHSYKGDRHLDMYRAHLKYGPVVRFAPNLISINSSLALKSIYGHSPLARSLQKSNFYSAFPAVKGVFNTHNSINKIEHARKRRVLSAAFSENALRSMENLVLGNIEIFAKEVDRRSVQQHKGIDMGEMFSWLTFDVMGELCFGKSFDMLRDEATRFVTHLIAQAAHSHYIVSFAPHHRSPPPLHIGSDGCWNCAERKLPAFDYAQDLPCVVSHHCW